MNTLVVSLAISKKCTKWILSGEIEFGAGVIQMKDLRADVARETRYSTGEWIFIWPKRNWEIPGWFCINCFPVMTLQKGLLFQWFWTLMEIRLAWKWLFQAPWDFHICTTYFFPLHSLSCSDNVVVPNMAKAFFNFNSHPRHIPSKHMSKSHLISCKIPHQTTPMISRVQQETQAPLSWSSDSFYQKPYFSPHLIK